MNEFWWLWSGDGWGLSFLTYYSWKNAEKTSTRQTFLTVAWTWAHCVRGNDVTPRVRMLLVMQGGSLYIQIPGHVHNRFLISWSVDYALIMCIEGESGDKLGIDFSCGPVDRWDGHDGLKMLLLIHDGPPCIQIPGHVHNRFLISWSVDYALIMCIEGESGDKLGINFSCGLVDGWDGHDGLRMLLLIHDAPCIQIPSHRGRTDSFLFSWLVVDSGLFIHNEGGFQIGTILSFQRTQLLIVF